MKPPKVNVTTTTQTKTVYHLAEEHIIAAIRAWIAEREQITCPAGELKIEFDISSWGELRGASVTREVTETREAP